jgi:PHD and RING finger domain-containing protein 1
MSEESDQNVFSHVTQKRKRSTRRMEDSGSSSSSRPHKRVVKVCSDPDTDSDGPLEGSASRVQQVMSVADDSSDGSEWGDSDDHSTDDSDSASEECSSTIVDSGGSTCSDGENLEEEEERCKEAGSSSGHCGAASAVDTYESRVGDGGATVSAVYTSDSSDGQSEKCPICWLSFTTQEIATLEACDHSFCVGCLLEWSKNANTCPLDRQMFTSILVRRFLGGEVIRRLRVEPPTQEDEGDIQEFETQDDIQEFETQDAGVIVFLEYAHVWLPQRLRIRQSRLVLRTR